MTKQEAIEILTEMRDWNDYITQSDALQMAIDALEKKPAANSEDAISRQAVMDGLEKYHDGADLHIDGLTYAYDLVCKLPSVSTEKPNRCKDCSYFQPREKAVYINTNDVKVTNGSHTCFYWDGSGVPEDGFCHNFEKMWVEE